MLGIIALIVSGIISVYVILQSIKSRREKNQIWDRIAVNDVHIQRIQEQAGIEKEPEESRTKVKPLKQRAA